MFDAAAGGRLNRRLNARMIAAANRTMRPSSTTTTTSAATGYLSARKPSPTTNRSSPRLSSQLVNGSGLVFAMTRVPALVTCVLPATMPPSSAVRPVTAGEASPSVVIAMSAPPTGRMNVWSVSQMVSTQGILSARNSTT